MNNLIRRKSIAQTPEYRTRAFSKSQRLARRLVLTTLAEITQGCLRVHEAEVCHYFGVKPDRADLVADVHIHNPRAYIDIAFAGSIGSGEAYMSGYWSSPNVTSVVRVLVRNINALDTMDGKQAWLSKQILRIYAWFNRNDKKGARRNISAHYDLGNEFFSLFLDSARMYSAAIYPHASASLEEAAQYKLKVTCDKLALKPQDHLLEIGSGWGGLAIYAAAHYDCKVTTTTISQEQYNYTCQAVKEANLEDKITVLCEDYRDLQGEYSKLVSIEMIEAVGHEHYAQYFFTCSKLLQKNGLMLLQAITIADQRYDMAKSNIDFIQRYIFPGGGLPSVAKITELMRHYSDLNLLHFEDIATHYARTLKHWRLRFMSELDRVRGLGFDERFIRMWEYYLHYCEGGFLERSIGTGQFLLAGPQFRYEE